MPVIYEVSPKIILLITFFIRIIRNVRMKIQNMNTYANNEQSNELWKLSFFLMLGSYLNTDKKIAIFIIKGFLLNQHDLLASNLFFLRSILRA